MDKRKTLSELTLKDDFMFGAVMSDEDNCRKLLEMILQFPIEKVEVRRQKHIDYHPDYKGIRLDVYAKDTAHTHYNVEMQALRQPALGRRSRYYHSQIDMELLLRGAGYPELPNTYVIFICDFDPFGENKYCYTFENRCLEVPGVNFDDGSKSIFLSTYGQNEAEVPEEMVKFLKYVRADLPDSTQDFENDFVSSLQNAVKSIKASREWEERFMRLQEMLRDERAEGKAEGIAEGKAESVLELLYDLGAVSEELEMQIMNEQDTSVLKSWLKLAAKSESIEQFLENM